LTGAVGTGAGAVRRPRRISGGKTSSTAGFLSSADRDVEGAGGGCDGWPGPGVGVELSIINPNDDTRRTDAGEPGRDGDDTALKGAEPGVPTSSPVSASFPASSSSER